jgi:hypothetical protein
MLVNLILAVIFIAAMAMLAREGLWSNTLTLINVLAAGIFATNVYEPVSKWLLGKAPGYEFFWDFLAIWGAFVVFYTILRLIVNFSSLVRLRFIKPVETAGGLLLAAAIGWSLVCFTTMTLHTAPLRPHFLRGDFLQADGTEMFFGLKPDVRWLELTKQVSTKSLATTGPNGGVKEFDPTSQFRHRYLDRRKEIDRSQKWTK